MNEFEVDGIRIPFDPEFESIAISLSGGADSALLAYLLLDHFEKNNYHPTIHIISHIRMWKTRPWQQQDSLRVYNYLVKKFFNFNFHRHTNFVAPDVEYGNIGPIIRDEYGKLVSGDNAQIRAYSEYVCFKEKVNAYYNAVTRNPKNVEFLGMVERDIDLNETNAHLRLMKHMEGWAIHPFRFVQKDWVIKQYLDNGLEDYLNLTRSCEGEFEGLDYKTYVPGQYVPTCGECFWCKEREWAIEQAKQ